MTTHRSDHRQACAVAALVLVTGVAAIAQSAAPQPAPPAAAGPQALVMTKTAGSYFFQNYCAVCHGPAAKGNGPLAASLRRPPADLTAIAAREKGVFPAERVYQIIDGRKRVPGHGGPDMPVWGDAFRRSDGADENSVRERIQAIVDYLETLQPGPGM